MADVEKEPCPFCGSADLTFDETDERTRIHCLGCGTESGLYFFSQDECASGDSSGAEARAIAAWNRRALPPADAAEMKRLADALEAEATQAHITGPTARAAAALLRRMAGEQQ